MAAVFILLSGSSTAEEVTLPDEVFFYRPVASVFGQSSVWNNPAALSKKQTGSVFIFSHRDNRFIRDWGGAVTMQVVALAYREVDFGDLPDLKEYIIAMGGGRKIRFGMSYRYIKEGPGYLNHRHLWNLALLNQATRNLSIGARFENLNRGRIDGERSDIRIIFGAASRTFRDLVTVSFDVDMTQKENLSQADFRTGIEVRPKPGLYLFADFTNHSQFNLGFRVNLGSGFGGHYQNFDEDFKSYGSTTYIGQVKGKQPSLTKPRPKTMVVRLDGGLPENRKSPVFGKKPLKYYDYIDGIYQAADDDEIDVLFLNIGNLKCGLGKTEELSDAVKYFRSRGKKVVSYIATPNNLGYLLASASDRVIIPPISQLNLIGLRANLMTIKGLMDKVGVEAEFERVEDYKSAPEMFMFDRPTEPHREQINRILDNLYGEMVDAIAANRGLTADSVRTLIDKGPLTSADAVAFGLVDELSYLDDALDNYADSAGGGFRLRRGKISLRSYVTREEYHDRWGEPDYLALVIADGDIKSGKSGGHIGDYEMLGALKKARQDGRVKGVVLRVNSPGGSALASDLIWNEIEKTVEKKPVVISMSNVAASGGYYISSIDSEILVDRNTITGSIGVYGGKVNVSELLDKVGIYTETYHRGQNAAVYSPYQPFTEDQRRQLKDHMLLFYRHFTEKVGQARGLSADSVDNLGQGRVWTGTEAVANGLADNIGGIHRAILALCEKSGVNKEEAVIVSYPQEYYLIQNPFDFPQVYRKLAGWLAGSEAGLAASNFVESDYIFFRMPYNIEIE
jgi:protease-4